MPTAIQQYHSAERAAAQRRFASSSSRFEARSRCEGRQKRIVIADATMQVREHPRGAKRLWSAELQFRFQVAHKLQASWTAAPVKAGRDWKAEMNLRTPKLLCDRQGGGVLQRFSVAVRVMSGGNALTAGNKNSRRLFLIPASAFARKVLLRLRSAFADLTFRFAPEPRLRAPAQSDQRSAAGPRPASCRWRCR